MVVQIIGKGVVRIGGKKTPRVSDIKLFLIQ